MMKKIASLIPNRFKMQLWAHLNAPIHKSPNGTKVIFIHINKTAGTSITQALNLPRKQHLTVGEVIKIVGKPKYQSSFSFTVVRNPFDRIVSLYKHRINTNQSNLKNKHLPFNDWIEETFTKKNPSYFENTKFLKPQVEWLRDESGDINVDSVLKFETLADDFPEVAKKLGISTVLPHLNKSNLKSTQNIVTEFTTSSKEVVIEWFREDFQIFDYKF